MKNFKKEFLKDFDVAIKSLLVVKEYSFEDSDITGDFHDAYTLLRRLKKDLESNELQVIKTENLKEVLEVEDFLREKGENNYGRK